MDNFLNLVENRESVRAYKDTPVDKELLKKCVQAAHLAPSACNSQPWRFIIIDNPDLKNKIATAAEAKLLNMNKFTTQAPIIVAIVNEGSNFSAKLGGAIKSKTYHLIDIGIAVEHFCLQATEQGLGTCILGWFDEKKVKELLQIPKKKRVELLITVGYPANDKLRKKVRKPIDEIVSYNKY